jgi:extracellular factor (EF) 3-hydroxypalmitic acid methyl ester biosynthesis protein
MSIGLAGTSNGTTHVGLEQGLLDDVYEKLSNGRVNEGMNELLPGLKSRRLTSGLREWTKLTGSCLAHPLRELLHQDPFTYRAFCKPRGYAGDAVLLDYIYAREECWPPPEGMSELGRQIFEYTTRSAACEGVRARRGFIADLLDRLVEEIRQPDVLSIAAGHLREAHLSSAVRRRKLGRFVALDSDAESLKEVEHCYGRFGVEVLIAPIRRLLTQKIQIGPFDVVYSMGLFDYLQQSTAQRLTWVMFQMLRPGGRLLVANFLPGIADYGYMESYMDWKLTYRTRLEMVEMSACIPQAKIRDMRIFAEENQNIIFLQVTKQ